MPWYPNDTTMMSVVQDEVQKHKHLLRDLMAATLLASCLKMWLTWDENFHAPSNHPLSLEPGQQIDHRALQTH